MVYRPTVFIPWLKIIGCDKRRVIWEKTEQEGIWQEMDEWGGRQENEREDWARDGNGGKWVREVRGVAICVHCPACKTTADGQTASAIKQESLQRGSCTMEISRPRFCSWMKRSFNDIHYHDYQLLFLSVLYGRFILLLLLFSATFAYVAPRKQHNTDRQTKGY